MAGANAGDFAKSADTCTGGVLAPQNTCTVGMSFAPAALGSRSATLNFTDNAGGSPQIVTLSGTGGATTPLAVVAPGSLGFGNQIIGTTSGSQAVVLTNEGVPALTIANIGVTSGFIQNNNCGSSLKGGASCTLNVAFTPTLRGSYTGTLTITDDSGGTAGSTQAVSLTLQQPLPLRTILR